MKVYVTYVNEDDFDYYLWKVSTRKNESTRSYVEEDVPSFLSGGPSDISQLVLVSTEVSKQIYERLIDPNTSELDLERILRDIDTDPSTEQIRQCDGTINYDLGQFYSLNYKNITLKDFENDVLEVYTELDELSKNDPEQYNSIISRFTKQHFGY